MTRYYIEYIDYTGYTGGVPKRVVLSINVKNMTQARLFVIKKFYKMWIQKKKPIYQKGVVISIFIGTRKFADGGVRSSGQMSFIKPFGEPLIVWEPYNREKNVMYDVDPENGELIRDTKLVDW